MNRRRRLLLYVALPAVVAAVVASLWSGRAERIHQSAEAQRQAATYPDYAGIVIPPNVAPLNLKVLEPGQKFCLRLTSGAGAPVEVFSADGNMRIPPGEWRNLLAANPGGELGMDIYAKGDGGWLHFSTVRNRIAAEEIDPYVVYRYIPPIYNTWDRISLIQRDLRSFDERVLFDTQRSVNRGGKSTGVCINCHTFLNHGTGQMLLQMRPGEDASQIPAMILVRNGRAQKVDLRIDGSGAATYTGWHPGGKLLVFSRNTVMQMFHTAGVETREVVDTDSDLASYRVDTGQMYAVPQISRPDRLETFPAWSRDGRFLYFTSAPVWTDRRRPSPVKYDTVQYDLNRIAYDPETDRWGEVETVLAATQLGKSISLPELSPDGRFLLFCGHDFGSFPVFQPSSDLYLLDLSQVGSPSTVGKVNARRLDEIDSDRSDSYHSWSSNSRWIIFASKREDGVFGRLYVAHFDGGGRFSRPFVLPQQDPDRNGRTLMTFNRPELLREPVVVSAAELARAMDSTVGPAPAGTAPVQEYAPRPLVR